MKVSRRCGVAASKGSFNNPGDKEVKRRSNRSFKILNGYEHIDINICSHSRKII